MKARVDIFDFLVLAGFAATVYGISMLSVPASVIVGGVGVMLVGRAGSKVMDGQRGNGS
jgi:hypothetical protein